MIIKRLSPVLLFAVLPLAACEPAGEEVPVTEEAPFAEEEFPAGEPMTETPGTDMPATETPAAGAMITERISVTNSMPHPMIVMVSENRELGTVAANETTTFRLQAEAGSTVMLTARDSADTHTLETTVTADGTAERWTLGG